MFVMHGEACALDEYGNLVVETEGDWYGNVWIGSGTIWNEGVPYPGADHVQVTLREAFTSDNIWTVCLHHINSDGYQWYISPDDAEWMLTSITWRGECAPGEDNWHRP